MKNKDIIRYGYDAAKMRPMVREDILISRLNLLIIMAKAYLKSYPMGEIRRNAIRENARFVFNEAFRRTCSNTPLPFAKTKPHQPRRDTKHDDHLFLQRAQLLAVMVNSFVSNQSKGGFRKKAMAETIDLISRYFADGFQLGDTRILKVA